MNPSGRRLESPFVPIRWRIFGLLFAFAFLEYLQQRGLTVAAERMMPELKFTQMQVGWVQQAFVVGYTLFQFGGGVAGQRWGARRTLVVIGMATVGCIVMTVFAPEAFSGTWLFILLCVAQFLMGIAQAPTFPVSTGVFETWFEPRSWALVQGLQTMGLGLGGALAPPFVAALMTTIGWQQALLWTGVPMIPLVLLWAWYGRNSPREHRAVSEQELALRADTAAERVNDRISARELLAILRDRNVLLLTFSYFSMNYVYYLLGNWCFLYLVQERHFSVIQSGWLASAPPIAAGLGAGIGGIIASKLVVRIGTRAGLRIMPLLTLAPCGILLLIAVRAGNPYLAVGLLTACYGLIELTEGSFWATAMNVGRGNSMAVGGAMNTGGAMGGVVGIPIVAFLSGHGAWDTAFLIGTGCALASAACWLFIDAGRPAALAPQH